jgi:thymidylate kinase
MPDWIKRYCERVDGLPVQCLHHEVTGRHVVVALPDPAPTLYLHFDLCSDYHRQGRLLLSAEELLADARTHAARVRVPAPAKAFIYYLIKKIEKPFPFTGFAYLSRVYGEDPSGAHAELCRFFADREASAIVRAFEQADERFLREQKHNLRRQLPRRRNFIATIIGREIPRLVRRVRQPTGLMVAFLGPDGSGKTTLMQGLIDQASPMFRRSKQFHLRPLARRGATGGAPVAAPHAKPPRSRWVSLIKILFWWAEFALGYAINIVPAKIRSTLVVMDRYYDDLLIDPARYRWPGSLRLPAWGLRWVPRPDLMFVLCAEPDVLLSRKQEVERAVLAQQVERYRAWAVHRKACLIEVDRPVDQLVREVERHVLDHMHQRWKTRFASRSPDVERDHVDR